MSGWIGVDLDGTLAHYEAGGWKGIEHVGEPIPAMLERVKAWIAKDQEVRIFTARVSVTNEAERLRCMEVIQDWLQSHGLPRLQVTCIKDFAMIELWDDRAVQVRMNTGEPVGYSTRGNA